MLKISLSGIRNIQEEEGCVLHPYHGAADPPGIMTIYTGHVIRVGETFNGTQAEADDVLRKDLGWVQAWLWRHCAWTVGDATDSTSASYDRQHQFDACCSLVFNAGHVFDDLLAEINGQNRPDVVRALWLSHTRAGNDPKALLYRRSREVALYLTPDPPLFSDDAVREIMNLVAATSLQFRAEDTPAGLS